MFGFAFGFSHLFRQVGTSFLSGKILMEDGFGLLMEDDFYLLLE